MEMADDRYRPLSPISAHFSISPIVSILLLNSLLMTPDK